MEYAKPTKRPYQPEYAAPEDVYASPYPPQYTYQAPPEAQQQGVPPSQYQYQYTPQQASAPPPQYQYPYPPPAQQPQQAPQSLYPSFSGAPIQQQQQQAPPPPSYAAVSQQPRSEPLNEHNVAPYTPPAADDVVQPPVYSVKGTDFSETRMEKELKTSAEVSANSGNSNISYSGSDDSITMEEQDRQMAMLLQQEEIRIKKQEEDYDRRMNKHKRQRKTNRPIGLADPPHEGSSCIIA